MPVNPHLPEIQRRVDALNTPLRELAKDAWKKGFRLEIVTTQGVMTLTPQEIDNVHKVLTFRKRKH